MAKTANTPRSPRQKELASTAAAARKQSRSRVARAASNSPLALSRMGYLFGKEDIAWMMTLLHMSGGLHYSPCSSFYLPLTQYDVATCKQDLHAAFLDLTGRGKKVTRSKDTIHEQILRISMRLASLKKDPAHQPVWESAYGTPKTLQEKAKYYLPLIDHDAMERSDTPTIVLAKTVCNLRNYYKQTKAQTVELITTIYNPLCRINWSEEDIAYAWDLVKDFTPSLWLTDERYNARQRAAEVQSELRNLLECLTPGGRIPVREMHDLISQRNPDLEVSLRELGDAMRALTGKASKPSNGVSHYYDYQLPVMKDDELDVRLAELQNFFEQIRRV